MSPDSRFHITPEQWDTVTQLRTMPEQMRDGFEALHARIEVIRMEVKADMMALEQRQNARFESMDRRAELGFARLEAVENDISQVKGARALAYAVLAVIGAVGTVAGIFIGKNT